MEDTNDMDTGAFGEDRLHLFRELGLGDAAENGHDTDTSLAAVTRSARGYGDGTRDDGPSEGGAREVVSIRGGIRAEIHIRRRQSRGHEDTMKKPFGGIPHKIINRRRAPPKRATASNGRGLGGASFFVISIRRRLIAGSGREQQKIEGSTGPGQVAVIKGSYVIALTGCERTWLVFPLSPPGGHVPPRGSESNASGPRLRTR